ncbi:caspase domain-containing protein [Chamaesiphon sp.]|uniref:caspase family protein n=1 Tax=Chamaesiphon sp. TaxID=2814140 RepID=UPI00359357B0
MANQACISIGINQYQFLTPLSYGMADATAMEQFFIDAAGWEPAQCLLLTDTSPQSDTKSTYPNRENINRWLKQWSWDKLHHGDLLWFFFSGCGVSFGNEDYLIPIDGKTDDLANTCISIRQLYQQFRDIGVNALVFLDANHSQHLSLGGGIGTITAKLAQEYQIPTFLSCQSQEFSHEDSGLGHGLFTTALLEALNYHPDLNLETIDIYLTSRLVELSEHHWKPLQTPMAIIPTGVSTYRPVFSTTTQSSISSASIPEVVYTPPTPVPFGRDDNYATYIPPSPNIAIATPEPIGTGAIVRKLQPTPSTREVPHWAKISLLLTLMVAAGGGIYVFKSQHTRTQQQLVKPASSVNTPVATTSSPVPATGSTNTAPAQIPDLAQARLFVKSGDATSRYQAILAARKIPVTSATATEVKQAIEVWSQEIDTIAQGYAQKQYWQLAIDTAKMVPQDAPNYAAVQALMSEWRSKL